MSDDIALVMSGYGFSNSIQVIFFFYIFFSLFIYLIKMLTWNDLI